MSGSATTTSRREGRGLDFDRLVFHPARSDITRTFIELIKRFAGRKPILASAWTPGDRRAYGAKINSAHRIMQAGGYGLARWKTIFSELPNPLRGIPTTPGHRQLTIPRASSQRDLLDGEIMAIRHVEHRIEGLQFHPSLSGPGRD